MTTASSPTRSIPNTARWYVVHTYSGREDRTCQNPQTTHRFDGLRRPDLRRRGYPMQTVVQMTDGETKNVEKTMYPGYLLVQMVMNDDSWYVVRNTPGVTNFISVEEGVEGRAKPTPR